MAKKNSDTTISSVSTKLSLEQVRAYWADRQGLTKPIAGGALGVVLASGWMYSPGSTLPYLAIRERVSRFDRSSVDRELFEERSVIEVPAVRGCTMLVPKEDAALASALACRVMNRHLDKVRSACAITEREIRDLTAAVSAMLKDGPLTLDMLRSRLPANLVRDLGSAGKIFGERSTLTFTIRLLQNRMSVTRIAADRQLDSRSYAYQLTPREMQKEISHEDAGAEGARRFFGWAAPATLKEFAWWIGVSQTEARSLISRIGLVPVCVEDWAGEAWIPDGQLEVLRKRRKEDGEPMFSFLPVRDNYLYFRRGLPAFLDAEGRGTHVLDWQYRSTLLGDLDSLHHNAILLGNKLAGYWEYDPDAEGVVWKTCVKLRAGSRKKLESGIAELEEFIRTQMKDAAFYSFDGGKNRRRRIDSLR